MKVKLVIVMAFISLCFGPDRSIPIPENKDNIWYRPINGAIYNLDMSYGFVYADPYYVWLLVKDTSGEEVIIIFKNGSYFNDRPQEKLIPKIETPEDLQNYLEKKEKYKIEN